MWKGVREEWGIRIKIRMRITNMKGVNELADRLPN
jgi:hypothetical protein